MASGSGSAVDLSYDHVPENLFCPICFELPQAEVFQCREGHYLCHECYSKLTQCPECRRDFGKRAIRCRALETMLDNIKMDCPFKKNGCNEKFLRNGIKTHSEICWFNFDKFGSPIDFCKLIGLGLCNFRVNYGNTEEAIKHLLNHHWCIHQEASKFQIEFTRFMELVPGSNTPQNVKIFQPIVMDLKDDPSSALVILTVINRKEQSIAWFPLYFPKVNATNGSFSKRSPVEVEIFIQGLFVSLNWSVTPVQAQHIGKFLSSSTPLSIQISKLASDYVVNGSLNVKFCVKKKNNEQFNGNSNNADMQTIRLPASGVFFQIPDSGENMNGQPQSRNMSLPAPPQQEEALFLPPPIVHQQRGDPSNRRASQIGQQHQTNRSSRGQGTRRYPHYPQYFVGDWQY